MICTCSAIVGIATWSRPIAEDVAHVVAGVRSCVVHDGASHDDQVGSEPFAACPIGAEHVSGSLESGMDVRVGERHRQTTTLCRRPSTITEAATDEDHFT